jgi:hypothetical protein
MAAKTSKPAKEKTGQEGRKAEASRKPAEEKLDEALAESFPASDPPAPVAKGVATPKANLKTPR